MHWRGCHRLEPRGYVRRVVTGYPDRVTARHFAAVLHSRRDSPAKRSLNYAPEWPSGRGCNT